MFSILEAVRTKETLDPVEKLTNWELFQIIVSEPESPNVQMYSSNNEADKAARDFAACIASAYRPSARETTKLDRKYLA
jgi:hypothetical protein